MQNLTPASRIVQAVLNTVNNENPEPNPRYFHETRFLITVNPNRDIKYVSLSDQNRLINISRNLFRDHIRELITTPNGQPYPLTLADGITPSILDGDIEPGAPEEGPNRHRFHFHMVLTVKHSYQIRLDYKLLHRIFNGFNGDKKMYLDIKLIEGGAARNYIYKNQLLKFSRDTYFHRNDFPVPGPVQLNSNIFPPPIPPNAISNPFVAVGPPPGASLISPILPPGPRPPTPTEDININSGIQPLVDNRQPIITIAPSAIPPRPPTRLSPTEIEV